MTDPDLVTLELERRHVKQLLGKVRSEEAVTDAQQRDDNYIEHVLQASLESKFGPTMNGYQNKTELTAIYPREFPEFITPGLVYVCLGLAEAGEVQEKVKKAIREDDPSYLEDVPDELGDVLWYAARIPQELSAIDEVDYHGSLGDVAEANLDKLLDRKDRDALTGEGDDR